MWRRRLGKALAEQTMEEQPLSKPCTEGASVNKKPWLFSCSWGWGEAVGGGSQESSPRMDEREHTSPNFEVSDSRFRKGTVSMEKQLPRVA